MTKSRRMGTRLFKNQSLLFGAIIVTSCVLLSTLGPILYPDDPLDMVAMPSTWPFSSSELPLGSDSLGRDLLAGLLYGSRVSLTIGIASALLSLAVGGLLGAVAGYVGGFFDDLITRFTEIFQSIPPFIFLIVMVAILRPSIMTSIVGTSIVSCPTVARLVRAQFRSYREREFVVAAQSMGCSRARIMFVHILPNALAPLLSVVSVLIANAILMDAGLSFLGLGDSNVASWGRMINEGRDQLRTAWYISAIPGVALAILIFGFNALSDGLSDALNPRLNGKSN